MKILARIIGKNLVSADIYGTAEIENLQAVFERVLNSLNISYFGLCLKIIFDEIDSPAFLPDFSFSFLKSLSELNLSLEVEIMLSDPELRQDKSVQTSYSIRYIENELVDFQISEENCNPLAVGENLKNEYLMKNLRYQSQLRVAAFSKIYVPEIIFKINASKIHLLVATASALELCVYRCSDEDADEEDQEGRQNDNFFN